MDIVAWTLSISSIITVWFMGSKSPWGPRVALLRQALWFLYIIPTEQWALLPGVIVYTVVTIRNVIKWEREHAEEKELI